MGRSNALDSMILIGAIAYVAAAMVVLAARFGAGELRHAVLAMRKGAGGNYGLTA